MANGRSQKMTMEGDIAIIGLGGVFPDADDIGSFWANILEGRDSIGEVPSERWNSDIFYHPDPARSDKTYSKIGAFIHGFSFDSTRYKIPPATARQMDRTQQLAICAVDQALKDTNLSKEDLKQKRTAVILGNSMGGELTDRYALRVYAPWLASGLSSAPAFRELPEESRRLVKTSFEQLLEETFPAVTEDSLPGELPNIISGRVASAFDLNGQNCTVDAACASSMAALAEAVRALRLGDVDVAITGGVDSNMAPPVFVKFSKIGALSPDGSRPFDKKANGFVMGEGAGILILKRLDDALREDDRIYAVIKGVGSSSDGRGKGITAPNPEGQRRAIRRALASSGISASEIGLVEAHGTGTPVGDQTESSVLREIWKAEGATEGQTAIGSVKSQIGHLKSASGAASLIKLCLALHHKVLPPTINCDEPIPCINTDESPFFIPEGELPWNANGSPRRAGASAFGFGGTNFHVILEEAPDPASVSKGVAFVLGEKAPEKNETPYVPLIIGEEDRRQLCSKLEKLSTEITSDTDFYELAREEEQKARGLPVRVALAVSSAEEFQTKIKSVLPVLGDPEKDDLVANRGLHVVESYPYKEAKIAFLFPGQGSQYGWMMHDLAGRFPVVQETFDEADTVLAGLLDKPLSQFIFSEEEGERAEDYLRQTKITQPAVLTADIAMFRLLTSLGLTPEMVAGHSLGEYAACVAAGVLTFPEALYAVSLRGRAMSEIDVPDPGKMVSMTGSEKEARAVMQGIPGYMDIANKNGPRQTVVAGESGSVDEFIRRCAEKEIPCVELKVSAAFHSKIVAPAKTAFGKVLRDLDIRSPSIPLYANVTGEVYPTGQEAPAKIRELLNEQFAASVEWVMTMDHMHRDGARIFIECGPKRILANLAQMNLERKPGLSIASNHHKKPGMEDLCTLVALLRGHGKKVNWLGEIALPPADDPRRSSAIEPAGEHCGRLSCVEPEEPSCEDWQAVIGDLADRPHFETFMKMQGPAVKEMLRAGYEQFANKLVPMLEGSGEKEEVRHTPPVITGYAVGLPSLERRLFDSKNLDDMMAGRGFISPLPQEEKQKMLEKRVKGVKKTPEGETYFHTAEKPEDVIQLAGRKGRFDLLEEYGVEERLTKYLDGTSELAVAAALEALKDAGIPLVRKYVRATTGQWLPSGWRLPEPIRDDFGVIYASAFPGADFLIREISSFLKHKFGGEARKELIDTFSSVIERITDPEARDKLAQWFTDHYTQLRKGDEGEVYNLGSDFIFKALTLGHSHVAQIIGARGPNTHVNGACASTTQAIVIATDWIASGRAKRVLVVGADDPTNETLMQWMGSGMLAAGAATIERRVEEASLPFDNRRHGMILGMGAVGLVLETDQEADARGVKPVAQLLAAEMGNSAFHISRLDVDHISGLMERVIAGWEHSSGKDRSWLAENLMFMSHETYTPKRGGSAQAEIEALKRVFGPLHRDILIANVKGHTGHPFGAGLEDGVVLASLERGEVPPLANFREIDPELGSLNYSKGGSHSLRYGLRLAAGFGSQICLTLLEYKGRTRDDRTLPRYEEWLREVTGQPEVPLEVVKNVLRVADSGGPKEQDLTPRDLEGTDPSGRSPTLLSLLGTREEEAGRPEPQGASEEKVEGVSQEEPLDKGRPPQGVGAEAEEDRIAGTILSMIAEKTGYPEDMLEPDLDLEADLGIDTIKQAELFGQVRKTFDIPKVEGLKIADFPTITHLINWVKGQKDAPALPDPVEIHVKEEPRTASAEAVSSDEMRAGTDEGTIAATVLSMIAEKTGYPEDMLEPDLDLEADLGIDTIKQAELFGQVRKTFDIPKVEGLKIADFPTITHLINWVKGQKGAPALPDPVEIHVKEEPRTASAAAVSSDEMRAGTDEGTIAATVLSMIAEKTGYPEDMLEPDLDLEADLGIDTIKQAELFGQVRKTFDIPKVEGLKIADFPTITHLINWVKGQSVASSIPDNSTSVGDGYGTETAPTEKRIDTFVPALTDLPAASDGPLMQDRGPVLIAGGPEGVVRHLCEQLETQGMTARRVSMDTVLKDDSWTEMLAQSRETGVINLFGLEEEAEKNVYATFALYRGLAASEDMVIKRLLAAIATGGTFCLEPPLMETGATHAGGICGSTKAFQQEFAQVRCKILDLDPGMDVEKQGDCISEEFGTQGPLEVGRGQERGRSGIRLVPLAIREEGDLVVGEKGVVLATGGAKGITAECLKALIAGRSCRLAIIGTSPEPQGDEIRMDWTEEDWAREKRNLIEQVRMRQEKLRPSEIDAQIARMKGRVEVARNLKAFRDAGTQVRYLQADVSDRPGLESAIRQIREEWGAVDLVLHGAGREESKALGKKAQESMERLYEIKVAGLEHMREILGRLQLNPEQWILFSSITGRFGNAGQNDYSAANEALNFASRILNLTEGPRCVAPNWGPWAEIGMAARGSSPDSLRARDVQFIPPNEGAETLKKLATDSRIGGDILVAGKMGGFVSEEPILANDRTKALEDRIEVDAGPFSPRVSEFVSGERLDLTLTLDPRETPFLDHHRINGRAVLPGVASVALFAWVAELVQPDLHVRGLREISFAKPVKFYRDQSHTIGIEIIRSDEQSSDGLIFDACLKGTLPSPNASLPGKDVTYHRAKVIMGPRHSDTTGKESTKGLSRRGLSKKQIYRTLFHGPRFQILESLHGWNEKCLEACLDEENLSPFEPVGRFLTPWRPMAMEAAFQAAGLWTILAENKISLPFGLRSLEFGTTAEPVRAVCEHQEKQHNEDLTTYTFDVDVQDSHGRTAIRLKGLSTIEMEEVPESLRHHLPLEGEEERVRMVEQVVDIAELRQSVDKEGEALLLTYLQPDELDVFRGFGSEERAWAWLGGRVAAKKALHRYLEDQTGKDVPFSEIYISNNELGKPVCDLRGVHVSISHKETIAVACVISKDDAQGVGIDLEFVSPREPAMWEQFFTSKEQELALRMADEREIERSTYFTHLWSIKEAVSKAVGLGLRVDSRQFEVVDLSPAGNARVELHDLDPFALSDSVLPGKVSAWVEQRNGYVIARSLFERELADPQEGITQPTR